MKDHSFADPAQERRFHGGAQRLRSPARIALLETPRVVGLCTAGGSIATVLDVGTGTGIFAEAFLRAGLKTTGIARLSSFWNLPAPTRTGPSLWRRKQRNCPSHVTMTDLCGRVLFKESGSAAGLEVVEDMSLLGVLTEGALKW